MLIIPAIDLKDGRCVRLKQGRADDSTVYGDDPVAMAREWEELGAEYLHVVDLDGAFNGEPAHTETILSIAKALAIPVEVGGGLRTDWQITRLLDGGVARAIIGTRALADQEELAKLVDRYGEKLAVGIDARDGLVQVRGWVETSETTAGELARCVDDAGVETIIYTDTATDGMQHGPNVPAVAAICDQVGCGVVASGGITSVADIEALAALSLPNLGAAIVGKALYEHSVSLPDLTAAARGNSNAD